MAKIITKKDVLEFFGGVGKAARALGRTSQAISQWVDIPAALAYQIQFLSKGKLLVSNMKLTTRKKPVRKKVLSFKRCKRKAQ